MKTITKILPLVALSFILSLSGCYNDNEEDLYVSNDLCDTTGVSYQADIVGILGNNCYMCHTGAAAEAGLVLNDYNVVKKQIFRIRGAVNYVPGYIQMPQNGNKLSDCDLAKLDAWVIEGMPNN